MPSLKRASDIEDRALTFNGIFEHMRQSLYRRPNIDNSIGIKVINVALNALSKQASFPNLNPKNVLICVAKRWDG